MAKLNKLITYAYLKEEVDISKNIQDDDLEHKIYRAQETLRMILSDGFYQDFLSNFNANTLSAAYTSLLPYIKQYVAWQTYEFWLVHCNFKPTRSGIRVHSEENSDVATDTQMAMLIKDAKQQAQYYKKLLVDFIEGNSTDYPLYDVGCCAKNVSGNSFHISAVINTGKPETHNHNCKCRICR